MLPSNSKVYRHLVSTKFLLKLYDLGVDYISDAVHAVLLVGFWLLPPHEGVSLDKKLTVCYLFFYLFSKIK